jgi:hypothetical protein
MATVSKKPKGFFKICKLKKCYSFEDFHLPRKENHSSLVSFAQLVGEK